MSVQGWAYSQKKTNDMYIILFGGISGFYVENGVFLNNKPLPFINSFTTIKIDEEGNFQQYLMDTEYPVIPSPFSVIGNPLLFGTNAIFIPSDNLPTYSNEVIALEKLGSSPVFLGYIIGGIQSANGETSDMSQSAASPYIFRVTLEPR